MVNEVKLAEREAEHSPQSGTEVTKKVALDLYSPYMPSRFRKEQRDLY